jgi:nicotinamidase-related amidase
VRSPVDHDPVAEDHLTAVTTTVTAPAYPRHMSAPEAHAGDRSVGGGVLRSSALLTIDVQVDTLDGQPLEVPGTTAALPDIRRLCDAFRVARRPIVHVVRLYLADGSNAEPFRRELVSGATPVLRPGTEGRSLAPELVPAGQSELDDDLLLGGGIQTLGPDEAAIYKPRWGAFFDTPLDDHLRGLGVDAVVVAGCNFPNCPRATIFAASERDYTVVAAADAISGADTRGLDELRGIGVRTLSTADIVEGLQLGRTGG